MGDDKYTYTNKELRRHPKMSSHFLLIFNYIHWGVVLKRSNEAYLGYIKKREKRGS